MLSARYGGSLESPWDQIAIRYLLVTNYVAKKKPVEAFDEQKELASCVMVVYEHSVISLRIICRQFYRYFGVQNGWTLPALFSILKDMRDLAFDVCYLLSSMLFDSPHHASG